MIPIANFVFYLAVSIFGYIYVQVCNLHLESGSPFHSDNNTPKDFFKLVLYSPALFLVSVNLALKSQTDVWFDDTLLLDQDVPRVSLAQVQRHNMGIWLPGVLLGLQFTHLDQGVFTEFTLDYHEMKTWKFTFWAALIFLFVAYLFLLIILIRQYFKAGVFKLYFVIAMGFLFGFIGVD